MYLSSCFVQVKSGEYASSELQLNDIQTTLVTLCEGINKIQDSPALRRKVSRRQFPSDIRRVARRYQDVIGMSRFDTDYSTLIGCLSCWCLWRRNHSLSIMKLSNTVEMIKFNENRRSLWQLWSSCPTIFDHLLILKNNTLLIVFIQFSSVVRLDIDIIK